MAGKGNPILISEESMAKTNKLFSSLDDNALHCQKPAQRSNTSTLQVAEVKMGNFQCMSTKLPMVVQ
eukprot:3793472-Ditylum_brightwellii.AAC.1